MKIIRDTLNLTLKFRSLLVASDFKYSDLLESQITALNSKFHEYAKFLHLGNSTICFINYNTYNYNTYHSFLFIISTFCFLSWFPVLEKVNDRNHATHLNELLVVLNFNDYYNENI